MTRNLTTQDRGFALLLVLIVLAMAVVLGMSYLASAAITRVGASGYGDLVRARYLAESGAQHGLYLLRHNPEIFNGSEGAPLGPFTVDGRGDGYSLSAAATIVDGEYVLSCHAQSGRANQACQTVIRRTGSDAGLGLTQGVLVGGGICYVPAGAAIEGPMHVNGHLFNFGRITGPASATGWVLNYGTLTESPTWYADAVEIPQMDPEAFVLYRHENQLGEALELTASLLDKNGPYAKGDAVTIRNPAGVVIVSPPEGQTAVWLPDNFRFEGTLVVRGHLVLNGNNIDLETASRFPAIVVEGAVFVRNGARADITGAVFSPLGIQPSGTTTASRTNIQGTLVCQQQGYSASLAGVHTLEYDADLADVVPPNGGGTGQVEVVRWSN